MKALPQTGQIARVRQRLYLVENTVLPQRPGESTLRASTPIPRSKPPAKPTANSEPP